MKAPAVPAETLLVVLRAMPRAASSEELPAAAPDLNRARANSSPTGTGFQQLERAWKFRFSTADLDHTHDTCRACRAGGVEIEVIPRSGKKGDGLRSQDCAAAGVDNRQNERSLVRGNVEHREPRDVLRRAVEYSYLCSFDDQDVGLSKNGSRRPYSKSKQSEDNQNSSRDNMMHEELFERRHFDLFRTSKKQGNATLHHGQRSPARSCRVAVGADPLLAAQRRVRRRYERGRRLGSVAVRKRSSRPGQNR